jgi:hypothetical protein
MAWFSWLALILLSLFGYSGGTVLAAGRERSPKPADRDLIVIPLMWAIVAGLHAVLRLGHWITLIVGLGVGLACGWTLGRVLPSAQLATSSMPKDVGEGSFLKRLWERWKRFAARLGDFQSRVILGYFYFIVFLPFGLLVQWAVDPLRLRRPFASFWVERPIASGELDDARSQF